MLPFAHMGITTAILQAVETRNELRWVDYRILLFASLLPDLVDKPLAHLLFESRAFGHSFAFILLIFILGKIFGLWWKNSPLSTISLGTALHDLLDVMWLHPGVFLWPLYGKVFPKATHEAWHGYIVLSGHRISQLELLNTVGILLLLYFATKMACNDRLLRFMRTGRFD